MTAKTAFRIIFGIIKAGLMLAGIVFVCLFAYRSITASGPPGPAVPYRFGNINRGNMEIIVSCTGSISAVGTVEVGTQVSGTIENIFVDYNDKVTQGQILAKLDTASFDAEAASAEAEVMRAEAELKLAEAEYRRNRPLYKKGYISEKEFLPIKTDVDTARASLKSAQANLKKVHTNLNNATIRSPIDGTVIERSVEAGQTVAASMSTPTLFIIARDLSQMQIEADVDESDIGQIRENLPVRFTVQTWPDHVFEGSVRQIRLNPKETSNVINYTVVVNAPNESGLLLPGMTATVDFIVEHREKALRVPNAALRFKPDGTKTLPDTPVVWYPDKNRGIASRTVKTGITDGSFTEILENGDKSASDLENMRVITGIEEVPKESSQGAGLFSLFGRKSSSKSKNSGRGPGMGPPPF